MDQITLVELQIEEGAKLLDALRKQGFDVAAESWMKAGEDKLWYRYIASSQVERLGAREAYRQLHTIIRSPDAPLALDPFELRLVGANDPLVPAISDLRRGYRGALPMRIGAGHFAGRTIEGCVCLPG